MFAKEAACKALAGYEREKGHYGRAFDYLKKAETFNDSINEVNKAAERFPNFTLRLRTLYPRIKDLELVICCLIKLEITNTQMSTMLCKSIAAISNLRKRLYEKINGKTGLSCDFDEFIRKI